MRHEMGAGRGQVEVLTVAAFGSSGRPPATPWRKGSGVVMMSEKLVRHWEAVYRKYGMAAEMVNDSDPGDRAVARRMAEASGDVAAAWRVMAEAPDIPWWSMAALCAAAQAFEYQARDWTARAKHDESPSSNGRARHRVSYPVARRSEESR